MERWNEKRKGKALPSLDPSLHYNPAAAVTNLQLNLPVQSGLCLSVVWWQYLSVVGVLRALNCSSASNENVLSHHHRVFTPDRQTKCFSPLTETHTHLQASVESRASWLALRWAPATMRRGTTRCVCLWIVSCAEKVTLRLLLLNWWIINLIYCVCLSTPATAEGCASENIVSVEGEEQKEFKSVCHQM